MNKKGSMNSDNLWVIIMMILIAFAFALGYYGGKGTVANIDKVDTVIKRDTILKDTAITCFKEKPVPKEVYIHKIDTFYMKDGKDTLLKTENKQYQDTFTCAKDSIIILNYISGINSKLDSTKVNWKKQETIVTNTVEITKYIEKKRNFWDRLSIGPAVTAGYDPINKQWGVMVGASVFFDIK